MGRIVSNIAGTSLMVLELFVENPDKKFYPREISRLIDLSHKSASLNLKKLENMGVLIKKKEGMEDWHYPNFENPLTLQLFSLIETQRKEKFLEGSTIEPVVKDFIDEINQFLRDPVLSVVLYGDCINGEDGDIELVILFREGSEEEFMRWVVDIEEVISKIRRTHNKKISPLFITLKDLRKSLMDRDEVISGILKHRYMLYGGEAFIEEVFRWLRR